MSTKTEFYKDLMDLILEHLEKDGPSMAEAVKPMMVDLLHAVGHISLIGLVPLGDLVKVCVDEAVLASRCMTLSIFEDSLTDALRKRSEKIPEDQKN